MSEFGIEFTFGEYKFRAGAVMDDRESVDYYLTTLEYFHEYDFLNGGSKLPKGMWLDVGFLLDTPAVDLIYEATNPVVLDQYEDHCREDYTTPEDYE